MGVRDSSGRFIKGSGGGAVRDIDRGAAALMKRLTAKASELTVGIHEAEGQAAKEGDDDSGMSLLDVATIHEFGAPEAGIPQRSFIRDWADEMKGEHEAQIRAVGRAVVSGKLDSVEQGLSRLGSLFTAQAQKRMSDGLQPDIKQATKDRKGSSRPIIDTGQTRTGIQPYLDGKPIK